VKRGIVAFAAGAIFSAGLCLSGMTRPAKVLSFLDFFGHWDPSLALVMVGAIGVSAVAFRISARARWTPILGGRFHVPGTRKAVDLQLVTGAAIFGVGWGLSGLCPGPAVTSLASGQVGPILFCTSMLAGMVLYRLAARARAPRAERSPAASAS
jgi:uncharacterized membrane protein YedE/YeeE